jgi:hypothetical protein
MNAFWPVKQKQFGKRKDKKSNTNKGKISKDS